MNDKNYSSLEMMMSCCMGIFFLFIAYMIFCLVFGV
jgi:hypothetical protein